MVEVQMAVASAVIIPEAAEPPLSPSTIGKRRKSSSYEERSKRPRLSEDVDHGRQNSKTKASPPTADPSSERRKSGQIEERKRGQRLFGALLGTLSQSSSSTAQRRRIDIEKKQQAKLKLQAEEYDEKKKLRLEALMVIRRQEQKKYDKQSMQIRHSNLLAGANFLQTQAEPKLFYKPWELLRGDETKIKSQVAEAEGIVTKESQGLEPEEPTEDQGPAPTSSSVQVQPSEIPAEPPKTVGPATDVVEPPSSDVSAHTNPPEPVSPTKSDPPEKSVETTETLKDHGDDGGEIVLEAEEDTVIY